MQTQILIKCNRPKSNSSFCIPNKLPGDDLHSQDHILNSQTIKSKFFNMELRALHNLVATTRTLISFMIKSLSNGIKMSAFKKRLSLLITLFKCATHRFSYNIQFFLRIKLPKHHVLCIGLTFRRCTYDEASTLLNCFPNLPVLNFEFFQD